MKNINEELAPLAERLKCEGLSFQKSFNDNVHIIEQLRDFGFSRQGIIESLVNSGVSLTEREYDQYIYRAKKKTIKKVKSNDRSDSVNVIKKSESSNWKLHFPFIVQPLVDDILLHGFTIEDVRSWKVNNIQQLTKTLQQKIQLKKFSED
ncbi:hypothetical protein [Enterovibrio calviensis]|uniref:hypothetical protein n=1 Tax=Enterovibrio calviensis TaxID=91359 RepID=UPI0037369FB4